MLRKGIRRTLRVSLRIAQRASSAFVGRRILIVAPNATSRERAELLARLAAYAGPDTAAAARITDRVPRLAEATEYPVLCFGVGADHIARLSRRRGRVFDVDWRTNPNDGYEWHRFLDCRATESDAVAIDASRDRFRRRVQELAASGHSKAYVFGTGPSLEGAGSVDWSDGFRIACNTIVRDPVLWKHIDPHFIVAGDTIYHFGFTEFARAFRRDLVARLQETSALLVYPAVFDAFCRRELSAIADRLVPIPVGRGTRVDVDLTREFMLPDLGNVLNLLLLPLACTLARDVRLWGFDGRAPNDVLFWSNSNRHSYPEHMAGLQEAHPAFFGFHVPRSDPTKYVTEHLGDAMEERLRIAEDAGFRFRMLHDSWTPSLQRRTMHGERENGRTD
jgi:hypothetical protein